MARGAQNQHGHRMGQKGARTRARILESTAALLEQRSVRDLTITEITARAGTVPSTFYNYFADVSSAVLALAEELQPLSPAIEELLITPWPPEDAYRLALDVVQHYSDFWNEHYAILRMRSLAAQEGDRRFILARRRSNELLLKILTNKIETTGLEVDSLSAAIVIVGLLDRIPGITKAPMRRRSRPKLLNIAAFILATLGSPGFITVNADRLGSPGRQTKPSPRRSTPKPGPPERQQPGGGRRGSRTCT